MAMTPGEVENVAFSAANRVVQRMEGTIRREFRDALDLHAAKCPIALKFTEQQAEARGRKAVWALVIAGAATFGSFVGPFVTEGLGKLFGGHSKAAAETTKR